MRRRNKNKYSLSKLTLQLMFDYVERRSGFSSAGSSLEQQSAVSGRDSLEIERKRLVLPSPELRAHKSFIFKEKIRRVDPAEVKVITRDPEF